MLFFYLVRVFFVLLWSFFCALLVVFVSSAHIIGCVWTHIFCLAGRYVTGMIADMPSHIRTLFLFLGPVRILSCFASSSNHSDSLSIHSCLRSYRREYNKGTSLIIGFFSFIFYFEMDSDKHDTTLIIFKINYRDEWKRNIIFSRNDIWCKYFNMNFDKRSR
jgi:hypothetical protein